MVNLDLISFVDINKDSKLFLDFLESELKSNNDFTYFSNRSIECLDNHIITVLLIYNGVVSGYGHIDNENHFWLGVYVSKNFRSLSLGNQIVLELLKKSKELSLEEIVLSVFKTNHIAYSLYLKLGFKVYDENNKSFFMKKHI
jgi:ribosomal protein S18 acetylase RimI-like enzyme